MNAMWIFQKLKVIICYTQCICYTKGAWNTLLPTMKRASTFCMYKNNIFETRFFTLFNSFSFVFCVIFFYFHLNINTPNIKKNNWIRADDECSFIGKKIQMNKRTNLSLPTSFDNMRIAYCFDFHSIPFFQIFFSII